MKTTQYAIFYPLGTLAGKWHAPHPTAYSWSLCAGARLFATDESKSIHVQPGTLVEDVHPIVCRSCLRLVAKPLTE